jgi:hypothetical protein
MLGINAATGFGGHLIMGQINGSTRFSVEASGGNVYSSGSMTIGASQPLTWNGRASLYSEAAGILQIGLDAAAPAEATYKGADARSGTDTNTVGGILNIAAGRGTGTAAGGTLNLQTSTPTTSGTGAGTLTTRVAITEASVTISLPEINSTNGAASISARKLSGTVFTGGTGTTTYPLDLIASSGVTMPTTWSTSGTMQGIVAPTGFAGNFAHYSVNGAAAVYTVSSAGIVTASRFVDSSGIMGIWSGTIRVGTACNFSFSSTTGYTGATDAGLARNAAGVVEVNSGTNGTLRDLKARNVIIDNTLQLKGFTVATLPAGTVGMRAYVTDATAPTYNGALTGGGAVTIPVFYNGAAWVSA